MNSLHSKCLVIVLSFLVTGCSAKSTITNPCNKETITRECIQQYQKKYGEINISVEENDSLYKVLFAPSKPAVSRSGGYLEIAKSNCVVIKEVYYQ